MAGFKALVEGEPAKMVGSHFGHHMVTRKPRGVVQLVSWGRRYTLTAVEHGWDRGGQLLATASPEKASV